MGIKWEEHEIEPQLKEIANKTTSEFIEYLDVKDILDINVSRGMSRKQAITKNEWQKLTSYIKIVLDKFIVADDETQILYDELIECIANERLHLKTYEENQVIVDYEDKLDQIIVVLNGRLDVYKK